MEKDEILAKSRKEKKDEGVQYATALSERVALGAGFFICALFFVLATVFNNKLIYQSTWLMYCVMLGAQQFTLFKTLHKKYHLIAGIIFTILSVAYTVQLILTLRGM